VRSRENCGGRFSPVGSERTVHRGEVAKEGGGRGCCNAPSGGEKTSIWGRRGDRVGG